LTVSFAASMLAGMPMRRLILIAFLLVPGVALAGSPQRPLGSYNDPFLFGMTPDEVARLVDAPLIYLSGPRGSERYMVERLSTVPGWYPVDTRIILQFRRGRLTGWRRDWQMRPYLF
jgi:hypothetical protein